MSNDIARRELFASILRKAIVARQVEISWLEKESYLLKKVQVSLECRRQTKSSELRVFLLRYGEVLPKKGGLSFRSSIYARLLNRTGETIAEAYREATDDLNETDIALKRLHTQRLQTRADVSNTHRLRAMHQEQLWALSQGKGLAIIFENGRTASIPSIITPPLESVDVTRWRERATQKEQEKRNNTYSLWFPGDIEGIPTEECYYIDASCSTIGDGDLALLTRFANLKALNLVETTVTYKGLEHLRTMPILRTLFIPAHLDASRVKRIFWNNPYLVVNESKHDWMDHWITVTKL